MWYDKKRMKKQNPNERHILAGIPDDEAEAWRKTLEEGGLSPNEIGKTSVRERVSYSPEEIDRKAEEILMKRVQNFEKEHKKLLPTETLNYWRGIIKEQLKKGERVEP